MIRGNKYSLCANKAQEDARDLFSVRFKRSSEYSAWQESDRERVMYKNVSV